MTFVAWHTEKRPGAKSRRCEPCYDKYVGRAQKYKRGALYRVQTEHGQITVYADGRPRGKGWRALRATVLAEETHCGICGEILDKTITNGRNPAAPTIDHIRPIALGGNATERTNLRLAHRSCNERTAVQQFKLRVAELEVENERLRARLATYVG